MAKITDARCLSRYHWEDLLLLEPGKRVVVMVSVLHWFMKSTRLGLTLIEIAWMQQEAGIGGGEVMIGGKAFFNLKATMSNATLHHEAQSSDILA